ncbi:hypothetical protein [Desulfovibrio sp. UCD-KL4C]|uniref:hypothetical protein n=1 Tax=Desulfovibrio sp. UCD-KL4C TaxID=2578120 RepID=UPI0025B7B92E|nr:hypothetical protein [Desulfovibrio sp. UCD-KL4C]
MNEEFRDIKRNIKTWDEVIETLQNVYSKLDLRDGILKHPEYYKDIDTVALLKQATKECLFSNCIFNFDFSIDLFKDAYIKYVDSLNNQQDQTLSLVYSGGINFNKNDLFFIPPLKFENCEFNSQILFSNLEFKNYLIFEDCIINAYTSFNGSIFNQLLLFNHTTTIDCVKKINSENSQLLIDFSEATFNENVFISGCSFSMGIIFSGATFLKEFNILEGQCSKKNFNALLVFRHTEFNRSFSCSCSFSDQFVFENCLFKENVYIITNKNSVKSYLKISKCKFNSHVRIRNSEIYKIDIHNNIFENYTDFSQLISKSTFSCLENYFELQAIFNNTIFEDDCFIERNYFKSSAIFRDATFIKKVCFNDTISNNKIIIQNASLKALPLRNVNIESFQFIQCDWDYDFWGNKLICDEDEKVKSTFSELEEIFRRLKKSALTNLDQEQASDWHYKEKKFALKNSFINIFKSFSNVIKTIYLFLYYFLSGFGEKPFRALLVLLVAVVLPIGISYLWGPSYQSKYFSWESNHITLVSRWLWYLPFINSQIEGARITDWNYFWKGVFHLLITIQAALFAFALRNKLRR